VVAQAEFGIQEAPEPHSTFVENAPAKARHASLRALPASPTTRASAGGAGGAPGVQSARHRQPKSTREQREAVAA
jgi:XTP/dITP diphosphohydrolase